MENNNITIEQLTKFSEEDLTIIRELTSELGSNYDTLDSEDLQEMIDSPNIFVLVAQKLDNKKIVGMVTVIVYRIPYHKKAFVEDFVIDKDYRGKGIGTKLFTEAIKFAKAKGSVYVDFTSNPRRIEANKFYEKMGFKKRDTNVYRLDLKHGE